MNNGAPIRHQRRVQYRLRPYFPSTILAKNPEIRKNRGMRKLCSQLSIGGFWTVAKTKGAHPESARHDGNRKVIEDSQEHGGRTHPVQPVEALGNSGNC